MSWGTSYKYEGYLSRVGANELEEVLEEHKEDADSLWKTLIAYASATPADSNKDEDYKNVPYPEFIVERFRVLRNEMEEHYYMINHISDCLDKYRSKPEDIQEG